MNNCFLLISASPKFDGELDFIESVLRTLMRKFRKPICFYRIYAHRIRENDEGTLLSSVRKLNNSDAVIYLSDNSESCVNNSAIKHLFDALVSEHFVCGRCVISPFEDISFEEDSNMARSGRTLSLKNLDRAVNEAIKLAGERKKHIILSADNLSPLGKAFISAYEKSCVGIKDISLNCLTPQELLWQYMTTNLFSDVCLTDILNAKNTVVQLCAPLRSRNGFIKLLTDKGAFYSPEILPFDEMNNFFHAASLLACAAAIEYSLGFKSIAAWLRRAIGTANERALTRPLDEYISELENAINERIRTRRKSNENRN